MKKSIVVSLLVCVFTFLVISQISSATLYIDSISLDFGECYYYDNDASQFNLIPTQPGNPIAIDIGNIHVSGGDWDYDFMGEISVTPSDLTLGGTGAGYAGFSGGTITLTATQIIEKSTGDVVYEEPGGFVLLTAEVSDATWYMYESSTNPDKFISSSTGYQMTGGDLNTSSGSQFRMLDFNAHWAFPQTTPSDSDWDGDLRCENPALEMIAVDVPEPATLLLVLAGGLMLRKKQ